MGEWKLGGSGGIWGGGGGTDLIRASGFVCRLGFISKAIKILFLIRRINVIQLKFHT